MVVRVSGWSARGAYGMNGPPLVAYGRFGAGPLSGFGRLCKGTSCPEPRHRQGDFRLPEWEEQFDEPER